MLKIKIYILKNHPPPRLEVSKKSEKPIKPRKPEKK